MNGIKVIVGKSKHMSYSSWFYGVTHWLNLTTVYCSRWFSMQKIPPFPVLLGGRQMLDTAVDANRRHIVRLNLPFTQLCLLCLWVSWSYVWPSAVKFPLYSVEWLPIAIGPSVAKVCLFWKLVGVFFVCLFVVWLICFFPLCLQEN